VPGVDVDVERVHVIAPPNHEIFIRVFPELTLADEDIRSVAIVSTVRSIISNPGTNLLFPKLNIAGRSTMSHGGGKEPDALQSLQSRELLQGMRRRTHLAAMQMRPAIIPK